MKISSKWGIAALASLVGICLPAAADSLQVPASAPAWMHIGAAALLIGHIGGGTIGLTAGAVAGFAAKGTALHRYAGQVFLVSMFATYLIGAGVAPFLETGQRPNFVAGMLALYLLLTGVSAARNKAVRSSGWTWAGIIMALSITLLGITFLYIGTHRPTGTIDGSPPQAFFLFIIVGSAALWGDISLARRKQLIGKPRIRRHLWRMCASFFFASGSLFLGQPQVFPTWFSTTLLPVILAFLPLLLLGFWMVRLSVGSKNFFAKNSAN